MVVKHPNKNIPRHQVWKTDNIYQCIACSKMYSAEMTEPHTKQCKRKKDESFRNLPNTRIT